MMISMLILTLQAAPLNVQSEGQRFSVETMLSDRPQIWGFDFLPDGRVLFTEKKGDLQIFDPKSSKVTKVTGSPVSVEQGQGGLLDVAVHPKSQDIYISFTEAVGSEWTTALVRSKLQGNQLVNSEKIFSARPANKNAIHFGSRIVFNDEGQLWISVGDRNDRHLAQDRKTDLGKIIQMNVDGKDKKIFSWGHRNPQGLYFSRQSKQLWSAEFGPRGGDELNLVSEGKNYGWPIVTFGREYHGPKIGIGTHKAGMQDPVAHWVPSISPSGLLLYESDQIPAWRGNIFLGCLSSQKIVRLVLDKNSRVIKEESLLENQVGRVRSLRTAGDGTIWFSTDEGKLFRIRKL